ncbi:MAG: DUF167 domain-containing protein [Candidatus Abawacabacteria bacterium]|nr:DUF167 domain-containing protein [Candidatus Abawacabacteria bacterium]
MKQISVIVKAHPRRKTGVIGIESDGSLIVSLASERSEGKANKLLIAVLAEHFQVPPTNVEIIKGHLSSFKVVKIS